MQRQVATAASQGDKSQQELSSQLAASNKQVSALKKELEASQATLTQTNRAYQTLQKDAKDVVNISEERKQLREANQGLTIAVTSLEDEVESLAMTGIIKWFLAGSGVLLVGIIIGFRMKSRRRQSSLI